MTWQLDPSLRPVLVRPELVVATWACRGARRPWTRERAPHLEIGLQAAGAHLRSIGRCRVVVDAATATVHAAGDEYLMASPSAQPQRATVLLVRGALADALPPATARAIAVAPDVALLHARLATATDPLAREELALTLIERVADAAAAAAPRGARPPAGWRRLAQELEHVIATRHAERLTIAAIAAACGVSPFHACRVFRAVTGDTLHRRLVRVRLRVALGELPRRRGALAELALAAGFASHAHFTTAFRAEFGVAPSRLVA